MDWLQEPFDRADVMRHLDILLLRFAFFDGNLSRKQALAFLVRLEQQVADCIADLEAYAESSGIAKAVNTGGLVFSFGLDSYRALWAWTRNAQTRLSKSVK